MNVSFIMARFFIIVSLLLSLYTAWCALGLIMVSAHSGSDVAFPLEALERYSGDKNGPEYMEQVHHTKEWVIKTSRKRVSSTDSYAITFGSVAVVQFFLTLWLVGLGAFRRSARKTMGGPV